MGRIVILIFVGICFIGSAYGEGRNEEANPLIPRIKRGGPVDFSVPSDTAGYEVIDTTEARDYDDQLGTGGILSIISGIVVQIALIYCCCRYCCPCCPCYSQSHPQHTTAVTIVQPPGGYPGVPMQNNFSINVPTQSGMAQDLPPKYNAGGYTRLSSPNPEQSYIH